jgi:beta-glucosidase
MQLLAKAYFLVFLLIKTHYPMAKFCATLFLIIILVLNSHISKSQQSRFEHQADSLIERMTLQEKIGQLNQYNDNWEATGPVTFDSTKAEQAKKGEIGSLLNCLGVERTRHWQSLAMQSRLKIPLLFGQDVVHGFKTTFPIPLAEACSWDLDAIYRSARIAATEASACGINWTFAPMVDIARDPRWGRVMEGSGEDPYLGSLIAQARVKGFQGEKLGQTNTLMACAKHFAAYGAAVGGRDYNSVDMSDIQLYETYLPPFKACVDAGIASFMTSFNDLNGTPATGNHKLLTDILRTQWGFTGFVVSDWGAVGEMVNHGNVKNDYEAAASALLAGCDMDMESRCYRNNLEKLLNDGKVSIQSINQAVKRILVKKFELGLFDDPYKFCSNERQTQALNNPAHAREARDIARRCIVLLQNQQQTLPLGGNLKKLALIGPFIKPELQNKGFWDVNVPGVDSSFIVSQWEGICERAGKRIQVSYARGCGIESTDKSGFAEAVQVAQEADAIVFSIGERRDMSGEARSRSNIGMPGVQEELLEQLAEIGKPVIVLINAGRPLVFDKTIQHADAILYTWWLGSEAGHAIADVLFGDYNPSAKITMSFPHSAGQIPIYYNHLNTGRPAKNDQDRFYRSAYTDLSLYPRYEFGYGLSYTSFTYSNLRMDKVKIRKGEELKISVTITNSGLFDGEEIVQLYLRDVVGSIARPVSQLKDFRKIMLKKGETKTVDFTIDETKLAFFNTNLELKAEPGEFQVMIGASSQDIRLRTNFELIE